MIALLRHIKRSVLRPIAFAQYAAVGVVAPQSLVQVSLVVDGQPALDVTRNHVVCALRPLTIGIMFSRDATLSRVHGGRLEFRDAERATLLGSIRLRRIREIAVGDHDFALFDVSGSTNRCLPAPMMQAYHRVEALRVASHQRRNPHNFQLDPGDLRALFAYYICPRPVVLVSVAHGGSTNVFPMDLIGPTASPWFSMALRLTSGAVPLMVGSKRMALATVPLADTPIAYELGKHHKAEAIDPSSLPFERRLSPRFGLPVSASARDIREVEVVGHHEVGSHMLFLTRIVETTTIARDDDAEAMSLPLHHVHGAYRQYLRRLGQSVAELSS